MKKQNNFPIILLPLALNLIIFSGCCKDKATPSSCIQDKIEAFKFEPSANAVFEIDSPDVKLYLFTHSAPDAGDFVYNSECEEICVTNVEGYDPGMIPCETAVYDSPRTKIWEK